MTRRLVRTNVLHMIVQCVERTNHKCHPFQKCCVTMLLPNYPRELQHFLEKCIMIKSVDSFYHLIINHIAQDN
jgi:hypothetical protein